MKNLSFGAKMILLGVAFFFVRNVTNEMGRSIGIGPRYSGDGIIIGSAVMVGVGLIALLFQKVTHKEPQPPSTEASAREQEKATSNENQLSDEQNILPAKGAPPVLEKVPDVASAVPPFYETPAEASAPPEILSEVSPVPPVDQPVTQGTTRRSNKKVLYFFIGISAILLAVWGINSASSASEARKNKINSVIESLGGSYYNDGKTSMEIWYNQESNELVMEGIHEGISFDFLELLYYSNENGDSAAWTDVRAELITQVACVKNALDKEGLSDVVPVLRVMDSGKGKAPLLVIEGSRVSYDYFEVYKSMRE